MLHGLCIPEAGLAEKFDVILGGQLSDTYLKDHYMPKWQREHFRPKGPKERLGVLLRKILHIPSLFTFQVLAAIWGATGWKNS